MFGASPLTPNTESVQKETVFKITLVGAKQAGKSALIAQFLDPAIRKFVLGVGFTNANTEVFGKPVRIALFDTHRLPEEDDYQSSSCLWLCYDVNSRESLETALTMRADALKVCSVNTCLMVLVGCKIDVEASKRQVSTEEGYNVAKKLGIAFAEVSSIEETNVQALLEATAKSLMSQKEGMTEKVEPFYIAKLQQSLFAQVPQASNDITTTTSHSG